MPTLARILGTFAVLSPLLGSPEAFADVDADLGAKIAAQGTTKGVAPCLTCHGADGAGMAPAGYPRIAGLEAAYLAKQLKDYRAGKRNNPVMMPMAKGLTEDEIAAVSAHYAAMPIPPTSAEPPADAVAQTAKNLIQWGDWNERRLPACGQCHAPDGNGIGPNFPGISGQHASYLKAQLRAWKAGTRANDSMGLMKAVADQLTDAEIDALSAYYAAQSAAAPIPAENAPTPVAADTQVAPGEVHSGEVAHHGAPPTGRDPGDEGYFSSPSRDALPDGPFGETIRQGQAIFENTNAHPVSGKYVGNDQACGNCHIDAGRLAESAPLWAAWVAYPAYRSKNRKVNTYIERIQGCFTYSMNAQASAAGAPPSADSDTIVSLIAYSYWLAKGAPTGDENMPGRGYPRLKETEQEFDPERGAVVYAAKCALCHGENGAGVTQGAGRTLFPPLWGSESYNWGAGMHKIDTAAAFIKHNMPLGLPDSLSDQEAWDVAAFMNSHERPQDPRHNGDLKSTTEQFHGGKFDYYGKRKTVEGHLLGEQPASK
jgi:thiosulfate dehydrogenase